MGYEKIWNSWNSNNLHKWHHYLPIYEELLGKFESVPDLRILEIGVQKGGGCQLHKTRFPQASIVGLDIDPNCHLDPLIGHLEIGDQADVDVLRKISALGPYDIIIDDGGHTPDQQITSFYGLWNSLKFGGIYIVEDLLTNAVPGYTKSRYGINFFDLAKGISDKLSLWILDKRSFQAMSDGAGTYNYDFQNFSVNEVTSVKFFNGIVSISKDRVHAPTHSVR